METASIIDLVYASCEKVRPADSIRPLDSGCEHLSEDAPSVSSVWMRMLVARRSLQLIITIFRFFREKTDNHINLTFL